jgi:hypothetical protein
MDAAAALADLTEISSQIEAAAILDADGALVASTLEDEGRAERLARSGRELLAAAATDSRQPTHVEARFAYGSLCVAREEAHTVVASTQPQPPSGLVFYDLRACLRSLAQPEPKKPRRRAPKKASSA